MRPQIEHSGILTCARDHQKQNGEVGLNGATYGRATASQPPDVPVITLASLARYGDYSRLRAGGCLRR